MGLSSRTISPTSVIHDFVTTPPKRPSMRKAGTGRPIGYTISRACTSTVMGAFRRVAGSKREKVKR